MPPTNHQLEDAARRIPDSQEVQDALKTWSEWLDARDEWRRRTKQAEADAAANAAAAAVVAQAESARLERDKKFLSTYNSPMEDLRSRVQIGGAFDSDMHSWQAKAFGQLQAAIAEGHAKILEKLESEPDVCSGRPTCRRACGMPGVPCTCTTEDKLIKLFHTESARGFRVLVTQGGGKTLVECLLALLMSYDLEMQTCPPELKTRDISIISAPETVLVDQMRGEGLGVTDRDLLETMPMYTKTGIDLDVLLEFNSKVYFLPDKQTAEEFEWLPLRDRYHVFVGGIQMWGRIFAFNANKPEAERIVSEDIRNLIGDESHLGTGWKATPWEKCDRDASWGRLIQDCHKAKVFKFSGSRKEEEEKLPIKVECKACELIEKGLLCCPRINTWGFEGFTRSSDGSPYLKDKLDAADLRELRLGVVNFRLAGADIALQMLADRKGVGEGAFGLSVTGIVRVTGQRAYDGATPSPSFVAEHLNKVFEALPACELTGRKLHARAVVGEELKATEEQDIRNRSRWGLSIDFLVVEDKFTLGYSDISKKHTFNLRKVQDTPESKEAHKQFVHRANRPVLDPPSNVPESKSAVKRGLRIAALFHVGCGRCKNPPDGLLTDKAMKTMYNRCVQPSGSPDGLCRLCYDRVNTRAEQYMARLRVIGARQPNGSFRRQYYDIHELEINCMAGSYVNESIADWARNNECEAYMERVTRPLLQQHQAEVMAKIQNTVRSTEYHQRLAKLREKEAEAALAQEAAEEARRAAENAFHTTYEQPQVQTVADGDNHDDNHENDNDDASDSGDMDSGSSSGSSNDSDDSDNESVANENYAMRDDIGSDPEDADEDFDPRSEHEGKAGTEANPRPSSRRAAERAQREMDRQQREAAIEEAQARLMRQREQELEERATEEAELAAAEVLAHAQVAREANQAALDAQAAAVDAADEAARQQMAEERQQFEARQAALVAEVAEKRRQLDERREEQQRQEAEMQERIENERRDRAEAARVANERMRSVTEVVPALKLLKDERGDLSIEFTMEAVPVLGTQLVLAATKHASDLGSSVARPTNTTATKWRTVTMLGTPVSSADETKGVVVRSMPEHLCESLPAKTGDRGGFCILALPPGHKPDDPEKITFGDITYKTPRFNIDVDALMQDVLDREAAEQQRGDNNEPVDMDTEENSSPPDVHGVRWPVAAAAAAAAAAPAAASSAPAAASSAPAVASSAPAAASSAPAAASSAPAAASSAPAAAAAPIVGPPAVGALVVAPGLSIRELAEARVWHAVERADRPADADPAHGIPETRKTQVVKSWLMGTGTKVQHPDALLACIALDVAKADNDKRRRDNCHPRHMSRAWATTHGISTLYYKILECYIELECSNSPEAVAFKDLLKSVRHYSERYQCNPAKKWVPPTTTNSSTRHAARVANAPVYVTAENVLKHHPAGWALIQEAVTRLERNHQQTGGEGNIELNDIIPGVRGKVPRKRELVEPEMRNDGGLRFKKHIIESMPRLQREDQPRPPPQLQALSVDEEDADARPTFFGKMNRSMKNFLYRRFPAEISTAELDRFEDAQMAGLPGYEPCDQRLAHKYRLALERGLFIALKVSEVQPADSEFKITEEQSARDIMQQCIDLGMRPANERDGRAAGRFYVFCTSNPTPETPYAHLPRNPSNPSAVTDWLQAFERYTAMTLPQANFQQ